MKIEIPKGNMKRHHFILDVLMICQSVLWN